MSAYMFYKYIVYAQCLYALIALGHVVWRLTRGSVSADLKKQVSRRYLEFVIIFTFLGLPVNDLLKPEYDYEEDDLSWIAGTTYAEGWQTMVCGFGILMAISRLRDPLIYLKSKHVWLRCTCRRHKVDNDYKKVMKESNLFAIL